MTWTIYINFRSPFPRRLHIKFGFDWQSGFRGEDVKTLLTTTTTTTDAGVRVYYKLTLWASRLRWAKKKTAYSAKTEDHIKLKLYFNSRHPQHWFLAQWKMQHLCISWRNPYIWRLDFCQIIKSCSCFWMDHKSKQVYSFINEFQSIYDVRM